MKVQGALASLAALLLCGTSAIAGTATGTLSVNIAASGGGQPVNTMTLSDASGQGETNYPLQFGRPFLKGAIPSGQCPVVSAGGVALPTQADVKNRYPDGSAEFAVVAVVVPNIPANGSVQLGFTPGVCNNTPLTAAQMLNASYHFDAAITIQPPTPGAKNGELIGEINPPAATQLSGLANGGMIVPINGVNCTISGITGSNIWTQLPVELTACNSSVTDVSGTGQWQLNLSSPTATFGYALPPTDGSADLATMLGLTQAAGATLQSPSVGGTTPPPQTADARTMLQNGDYTLWTNGPVAQTIVLADDTPSRKYDLSPNADSYHPFRPRFEATFWPATHQVYVRAIGENGLSSEVEDLSYGLTITGGQSSPVTEESLSSLAQGALSTWIKGFWIGGTPQPEVNIDNNLAYLDSTRFIPNYDTSIPLSPATIANDYASWWTNTGHDIGGAGGWTPGMPTTGQRPDIGPEPSWDVAWLYTGDWRMRQAALGNADLAGWWPVNLREMDPTTRLNRADPAPVAPAVGTGYGKPLSITDRVYLGQSGQGLGGFLTQFSGNPNPPHKITLVGPVNTNPAWGYQQAHIPSPFFIPYILTGDPWYLTELKMWSAYDAATNLGGPANPGNTENRGPTGAEGGRAFELRGSGWMIRSSVEAAFAMPDADPFKTYLTILAQENLARWDGALGVSDPALNGYAEYAWAQKTGDPHSSTNFGNDPAPALHNWEAEPISEGQYNESYWVSAIGETEPWMQWFVQYALGRATELGFAAEPLSLYSGSYLTGMINSTGYPKLIASYYLPSWTSSGQITSWSQFVANLDQPFLTGSGYTGTGTALPAQFTQALGSNNYDVFAQAADAMLVDEGAPGAAQAWTWLNTNVREPMLGLTAPAGTGEGADPIWAIVPRTDHNTLPAQPTTPQ